MYFIEFIAGAKFSKACRGGPWGSIALERLDEPDHLPPLVGGGKRTMHGAEIVGHVQGVGASWDDGSHPRVAEQIFEKKLRPTPGELRGPIGNLLASHGAE